MREKFRLHISLYDDHWSSDNKLKASAITWNQVDGKWITSNNNYQIKEEDLLKLGLPKLNNDTIDLQDKKIYRFPKLTLPRNKVELLKEKYNCRIVRDLSKADISVVSLKLFDTILERTWNASMPCQHVYHSLKYMKEANLFEDCALDKIREFLKEAPNTCMVDFKVQKSWNSQLKGIDKVYDTILDWQANNNYITDDYHSDWILPSKNYKAFNDLLTNKSKMVLDSQIANIIDSELAVIDNAQYDEVEKMIQSSNIEDRTLAVEMLANCNIEKSFDVVSGLYFCNYDWFKSTNNWNTVNVKALRSRMKDYEGNHNTQGIWSFNSYIKKLQSDRKLTRFAVDKTREKLMNTLFKDSIGSKSEVFKVNLENLYIADEIESTVDE